MNQSVAKALGLLRYFTLERKRLSLAELSRLSGLSKPTTFRLLKALEQEGFVSRSKINNDDKHYQLGLRLFELGNIVAEQLEVRRIALPYMERLRNKVNEAVHLVVLDRDEALYIEKVETDQPLRLFTRVGLRTPLYLGSGPRLLLAYMEEKTRDKLLEKMELRPFTKNTIIDVGRLKQILDEIRTNGHSISVGEHVAGTFGMSAPIRDHTGNVTAALTIAIPGEHVSVERQNFLLKELKSCAKEISRMLGFTES